MKSNHFRLIDANLNRLREGLRVVEDIMRYIYDEAKIAKELKKLRHQVRWEHPELLKSRNVDGDVLKKSTSSEQQRENLKAIVTANIKRAQESARVLEEILKLEDIKVSEHFKNIRYQLYILEKSILEKIVT